MNRANINLEIKKAILSFNELTEINWSKISITFNISLSGGGLGGVWNWYDDENNPHHFKDFEFTLLGVLWKILREPHNRDKENFEERFNTVNIMLHRTGQYEVNYNWDTELIIKQSQALADVTPMWLNDRMISLLFNEGYGDETNWNKGEFTFVIKSNQVEFQGVLYKNGEKIKSIKSPLNQTIIEGILDHWKLTNEGSLKNIWKPWNKLTIISPHNDIDLDEDIEYQLVDLLI
jgi:hypothetical protein